MSDAIKAALDEAAKRLCFGHDGQECDMCSAPEHCYKAHVDRRKDAAFAIAAFLRALPIHSVHLELPITGLTIGVIRCALPYQQLAAAVEEAARND